MLRNFLWTGNPSKSKVITVAWYKTTKPTEGGIGIRILGEFNKAFLIRLAFDFPDKENELSIFLAYKL